MANEQSAHLKRNDLLSFLVMLGLAFGLSYIPFYSWPFSWLETFFHEISHGLAAIMMWGRIISIELNVDGSGLCTSAGGLHFLTAFSGYFGAVVWGMLIYIMADNASPKSADRLAMLILGLMSVTAVFWAADIVTVYLLIVMSIPFIIILFTKNFWLENVFVRFCGLYVLLDAIRSPLYLMTGESKGDAGQLAEMTWLPTTFWVAVWFCLGALALVFLFMRHMAIVTVTKPQAPAKPVRSVQAQSEDMLKKIKDLRG